MKQNPRSEKADIPTTAEFEQWEPGQVRLLIADKTVVFSPGGSSRWYFLEHGDVSVGYSRADQFLDYTRRSLRRTIEIADMMFSDGIRTLFVVGVMPGQNKRDPEYRRNLAAAVEFMANQEAQELYAQFDVGVLFRGAWSEMFEALGLPHLFEKCSDLEHETAPQRERWLIWLTQDDPIPRSLVPLLADSLRTTGELPPQAALCTAYYGRPLTDIDIFIGHNKPTAASQFPPLLTVNDLYFTVTPSYYLDQHQWRGILYDHLFTRGASYRDYTAFDPGAMDDLRAYYQANQGIVLGVGTQHASTQTWRPRLSSNQPG